MIIARRNLNMRRRTMLAGVRRPFERGIRGIQQQARSPRETDAFVKIKCGQE